MATSQTGWSGNYLVGLMTPFYHNFPPVNKKFWQALSGDFIDAEAKVLLNS